LKKVDLNNNKIKAVAKVVKEEKFDESKGFFGKTDFSVDIFQNNIYDKEVTKNYNIKVATDIISGNYTGAKRELDKLADEYRLQVKIIKERNTKGLDSKLMSIVSFISLLGAIFIFSSNFTGNVIGTKINSTSNWIGVIFFLVGLVGAFVYFRKNK
ncbi:MAG: hypothetical protein WCK29_03095, partial [archaeon]